LGRLTPAMPAPMGGGGFGGGGMRQEVTLNVETRDPALVAEMVLQQIGARLAVAR